MLESIALSTEVTKHWSSRRPHNISKPQKLVFKVGQLEKLKALFNMKNWDIEENEVFSCFERYIRTLSRLQENQQNFILELTERFIHLPLEKYPKCLLEPVRQIRRDYSADNLLFASCVSKADIGKVKSGPVVLYQFKGSTLKSRVALGNHSIIESFTPEIIKRIDLDHSHFVLVDDFIGTGESARGAIEYIRELFPVLVDNSRISILCIVAMKKGIDFIKSLGATVYTSSICERGISDFYSGDELVKAIETMQGIELSMKKLNPKFRFGYGQSEALVCMERCPNNTFPIYWYQKNDAPYER